MHRDFQQMVLRDRQRELDHDLHMAFLRRTGSGNETSRAPSEAVVLRLCCVCDDEALDRLGKLEGRPVSPGRHVVAEVGGTVVAALPLGSGELLADPFRPTAHLIPLLELRAKQIGTDCPPRGRFGILSAVRALTPARR
ncbi:MAG TPA: hypothetical protein VMV08_08490 [Gaiellaceae bacterium]|nr:hypothetical protein [Gaiellaceae bacterium]